MAVKFFRMSEKGSIKRPTFIAVLFTVAAWMVAMFFLREHPIICVCIAWPLEYFFFAIILSSPFRITLGKIMHLTRYHIIMSVPTAADRAWLEANYSVFLKTGLKMYLGEGTVQKEDGAEKNLGAVRAVKKVPKKTNVIYEDVRREV